MDTKLRHDMKNAVGTILGYSEMLQDEKLSDEQMTMIKAIERGALKLRDLLIEPTNSVKQLNPVETPLKDKNSTVLIVDDNEDNREVLALILKKLDLKLLFAENGYQAIEITHKEQPMLIFMDMHMPMLNGYEASKQIKHYFPDVKIALLSGDIESVLSDKYSKEYFDFYFDKPFNRKQIQSVVKELLLLPTDSI